VSAPARLEGSVQRAIVAAADGFLQQANVRAGDTVKEGQVLAELASQDLQLERRRRESEMRQHENAYKTAQSRNDRAQMVISQLKAGEAQALLALVDGQIERARIQAPFDGVVIKGDLSQNLGAPVQRGEVLLTIAPSDSFRIIVEVEETDIAAIKPGQRGQLVLAAMPERRLDVTVQRVVPVATAADARNYFEVEASLDRRGRARCNSRPLLDSFRSEP
jgi:multidrug resistance efflux pump